MNSFELYEKYSIGELVEKRNKIEDDPKNRNKEGSWYRFNRKARYKLYQIDWAIFYKLNDKKDLKT